MFQRKIPGKNLGFSRFVPSNLPGDWSKRPEVCQVHRRVMTSDVKSLEEWKNDIDIEFCYLHKWKICIYIYIYIIYLYLYVHIYIYILLNFFNEWIMMREVIGLWTFLRMDSEYLRCSCWWLCCGWFRQLPACRVFWRLANSHKSNLIGLILIQSLSILSLKFNSRAII